MMFGLLTKTRPSLTPSRRAAYRPRLEALESRLCPSGGLLDPTFGSGTGEVSFPRSTSNVAVAVAIQPNDGKIVSVGNTVVNNGFTEMNVLRLNPDGSLDTSFNNTGSVNLKVGVLAEAHSVALQPDGKILIGGFAIPTFKTGVTDEEFVVARLNSNGTLDSTFAKQGIFTWNPAANQESVAALAVLGDGSIAVIGNSNAATYPPTLFKLSSRGALVSSFGSGGVTALNQVSGTNLTGLAVAPNRDLIVSGSGGNTGLLFAVNPSTGRLDPSFNNGQGWVASGDPAAGNTAKFNAVTIQGNDIVTAGAAVNPNSPNFALLARFSLSGALDTGFANGGYYTLTTAVGNSASSNFTNVATELDGSLVVEGPLGNWGVGHFTADGQLDTTFGGAGTGFNFLSNATGFGLVIDASGRILVSGYSGPNALAFIARLTPPEAMIGSFTASANPVTAGSSETLTASNIASSSTITQVAFSANGTLLGYGTQTSPGVWTFTFTVNLVPGGYTLTAQAEDSSGVLGDPFALTLTVQ